MRQSSPTSPTSRKGQTPLPFAQIAVLMGTRLAEPIAYTVIFPFVNQMVEELGVTDNPDRVGFYSGLVESVFAFIQFFTVYHWAKLSDRIGRKPVILFGLAGVVISGSLFGLATSFWMMIVFRCLSGAVNGNVAVIRAAIGDVTDSSNSTEAFAMYGLTWTVGAIIGNALGGALSHPYERFPKWFGSVEIFRIHPYLLPCFVTAAITMIGIVFCVVFYRESLPSLATPQNSTFNPRGSLSFFRSFKSHKRQFSNASLVSEAETLVDEEAGRENILSKLPRGEDGPEPLAGAGAGIGQRKNVEWGFWELMNYKPVRVMIATGFLNSFVQGAWSAASLLFFFDRNNGLSMSASAIGGALAINGLVTILVQLILLSKIRNYLGISLGYKVLSIGWIFTWLLLPLLRSVLLAMEDPINTSGEYLQFGEDRGWTVSICVNLYLSFVAVVNLAGSLLMVLINTSAPDKNALGAINGICTAVGCMGRVIGPSSISALFAYSMDTHFMGGRAWWIFMVVMSSINLVVTFLVDEHDEDKRPQEEVAMGLLDNREDNDEDDELTPVEGRNAASRRGSPM
ncbi:uncharacterized protein I303_103628 [Kwoniella dejecticola CBS 10117]|uniref:Major facilitator superfamily (MFS) profile domain-containing protein n=1 Tax=Kwoniella dejecticola CBS 10117 TaxID=1296121 RepID=A0A1A6A7A2_9TREE|nr:uncharacterized protein I303_03650 [Kwoniella dejecticola CBS 10117]OBR85935.1 hypothetical protein I303_03650 [Kwoniella dejecticola CBS 10117]